MAAPPFEQPPITVRELAAELGGEVVGEADTLLRDVKPIEQAGPGDLSFIANPKYERFLHETEASCLLVSRDLAVPEGRTVIRCDDPYLAFAFAVTRLRPPPPERPAGIDPRAVVHPEAEIAPDASVGAGAVVEAGASVGSGAVVAPLAYVGHRCRVGERTVLHPHVTLYHDVMVGADCIIHSGAVLGADGFGFAPGPDGRLQKVPQRGTVVVEDGVEIGANTTIDRATLGETRIGAGSKIDNQVQIAHNVQLGPGCIVVAQAGISGSTRLGRGCVVAAQAGIVGHLEIGDGAMIAASAGVTRNLAPGAKVLGQPAVPAERGKRAYVLIERLPEMRKRLRELERRLERLEKSRTAGSTGC
ncbi:MAG: UDP-3-O-(3-hydroxymyristoyl)glucosamine N-acyltransferase [Planctomycetota bacterium]|nr:MAG: UDP-3-O-(3-hydroxymyristoyl)glucosamine N-acyltransferase [Planctomycetota bacterium]